MKNYFPPKKIILAFIIQILIFAPVYAHDEPEHTSDLEIWVSGIGIIAIILASIYSLWWKNPDRKKSPKNPQHDTDG